MPRKRQLKRIGKPGHARTAHDDDAKDARRLRKKEGTRFRAGKVATAVIGPVDCRIQGMQAGNWRTGNADNQTGIEAIPEYPKDEFQYDEREEPQENCAGPQEPYAPS